MIRRIFALSFLFLALAAQLQPTLVKGASGEPAAAPAEADDTKTENGGAATDSVADLIKQLDSNSFPERQQASQKLAALGKAAIPALQEAALQGSRETITRAIDVLKDHLKATDEATKTAAKEALEKIANDGKGTAARQAQQALNPKKEEKNQAPPGVLPGGLQFGGGNIQIQFQILGGGIAGPNGKRITTKNVNGVKTIEAEENGRKVKINDDPNKGIQMEVTETKDGKETTQKYEAKDADDLKNKHPDAHKLYEQYSQPAGNAQIQGPNGNPFQIPLRVAPNNIPFPLGGIDINKRVQAHQLDAIARQLDMLGTQLKRISDKNQPSEELEKAIESLKRSREELLQAKSKLEEQPKPETPPKDEIPKAETPPKPAPAESE